MPGPWHGPVRTDRAAVEPASTMWTQRPAAPKPNRASPARRRSTTGGTTRRAEPRWGALSAREPPLPPPRARTEPPRSPLGAIATRPGGHSHPRGEDLDAVLGRHGCGGAGSGCRRCHRRGRLGLSPPPSRDSAPPPREAVPARTEPNPDARAAPLVVTCPPGAGRRRRDWLRPRLWPPATRGRSRGVRAPLFAASLRLRSEAAAAVGRTRRHERGQRGTAGRERSAGPPGPQPGTAARPGSCGAGPGARGAAPLGARPAWRHCRPPRASRWRRAGRGLCPAPLRCGGGRGAAPVPAAAVATGSVSADVLRPRGPGLRRVQPLEKMNSSFGAVGAVLLLGTFPRRPKWKPCGCGRGAKGCGGWAVFVHSCSLWLPSVALHCSFLVYPIITGRIGQSCIEWAGKPSCKLFPFDLGVVCLASA